MENHSLSDLNLILTCEHAGNEIPDEFSKTFRVGRTTLMSHRGWDPGALALALEYQKATKAKLFAYPYTRLLIEANRSIGHPQLFSEYSDALAPSDKQILIEQYYLPYRKRIRDAIKSRLSAGMGVLHLSVHTFTPVLDPEKRAFDIGLLYDPARPGEKTFCRKWKQIIQSQNPDTVIYMNRPYRGNSDGLTTTFRKQFPPNRYLGVELEVNQKNLLSSGKFPASFSQLLTESLIQVLIPG